AQDWPRRLVCPLFRPRIRTLRAAPTKAGMVRERLRILHWAAGARPRKAVVQKLERLRSSARCLPSAPASPVAAVADNAGARENSSTAVPTHRPHTHKAGQTRTAGLPRSKQESRPAQFRTAAAPLAKSKLPKRPARVVVGDAQSSFATKT